MRTKVGGLKIWFSLWPTSFTWHSVFRVHSCCDTNQYFILFCWQVISNILLYGDVFCSLIPPWMVIWVVFMFSYCRLVCYERFCATLRNLVFEIVKVMPWKRGECRTLTPLYHSPPPWEPGPQIWAPSILGPGSHLGWWLFFLLNRHMISSFSSAQSGTCAVKKVWTNMSWKHANMPGPTK